MGRPYHGNADGVGCPNSEGRAVDLTHDGGVAAHSGTKNLPETFVTAFGDEVDVRFAKCG